MERKQHYHTGRVKRLCRCANKSKQRERTTAPKQNIEILTKFIDFFILIGSIYFKLGDMMLTYDRRS
jgi:hypothetical protein